MLLRFTLALLLIVSGRELGFGQEPHVIKETSQDFSEVAKIAIPAVVSIQVKSTGSQRGNFQYDDPSLDLFQDDFFGSFFGIPRRERSKQQQVSQASGFIVSPDGYILTNNHVVSSHGTITVRLNSGKEYQAKIIGEDDATDVALLKIDAKDLPYLKLGNSDQLNVGQWVVAIGNLLGMKASLTVGVVSAKGRSNLDIAPFEDFIQTDAAINRGNSGGPLLNLRGEVIGINTAIATNYASGYMGIGFAIPSNMAKLVMDQLLANGKVSRGFIGVILQNIDSDLAEGFGLTDVEGALVADVVKDSPAAKAGIKQGDILLKYNGQIIDGIGTLRNFIAHQSPGTQLRLNLLRDKQPLEITVTIETSENSKGDIAPIDTKNKFGLEVQTLTPELGVHLNKEDVQGVIVTQVTPRSPAELVGIKKGAVITQVNNQKVTTKQEFDAAVSATPAEKPVVFLLKQGDATKYVSLRVGK